MPNTLEAKSSLPVCLCARHAQHAVQIRKQLTKHSVPHFCPSLSSTRNLHCLFVMGFSILHCCLVRPLGKWHPTPSYSSHALFWCHPPVRSSMGSASWNSVFTDSCYLTHTISHHLKPKHLWPVEDSVFPSCPRVPVGVILSGALRRDVLENSSFEFDHQQCPIWCDFDVSLISFFKISFLSSTDQRSFNLLSMQYHWCLGEITEILNRSHLWFFLHNIDILVIMAICFSYTHTLTKATFELSYGFLHINRTFALKLLIIFVRSVTQTKSQKTKQIICWVILIRAPSGKAFLSAWTLFIYSRNAVWNTHSPSEQYCTLLICNSDTCSRRRGISPASDEDGCCK